VLTAFFLVYAYVLPAIGVSRLQYPVLPDLLGYRGRVLAQHPRYVGLGRAVPYAGLDDLPLVKGKVLVVMCAFLIYPLLSRQNIPGKEKYTQTRHMKQYGILCRTKIRFNILILEFNFSLYSGLSFTLFHLNI